MNKKHRCSECMFYRDLFFGGECIITNTHFLRASECRLKDDNENTYYERENEYLALCEDGHIFGIKENEYYYVHDVDGNRLFTHPVYTIDEYSAVIPNSYITTTTTSGVRYTTSSTTAIRD